jgi:hypothetical protein
MSENKKYMKYYSPNNTIIKKLVEITDDFKCIDIGLVQNGDNYDWCVVEINPPFSLDDYDIPFEEYIQFCIDACLYINSRVAT